MPRRAVTRMSAAVVLVLSACVAIAAPAVAEPPSAATLAGALDAPAGVVVGTDSSDPTSYAVADRQFNDFPAKADDYVVLSTGRAADVFSPTVPDDQPSTDLGSAGPDTSKLTLTVPAQETAQCLLLDFAMGTEERVHTYVETAPSDRLSVTREGDSTERAMNAGGAYFTQADMNRTKVPAPSAYEVNAVKYWHQPGEESDPAHGTVDEPRLPDISAIDNFATRDTAEVPIPAGSQSHVVNVSIQDRHNGLLDSVALIDNVRLKPSCSFAAEGMSPSTGVSAVRAVIVGHRGVGNVLTLDPVRATTAVEKYDNRTRDTDVDGNGWFPGDVELRFRWYRGDGGTTGCYSTVMTNWVAIPDADRQSYVPTNLDKSKCLMALVTGMKDGFRRETFPNTGSTDWWHVTLPIQDGTFDGQKPTIACDIPPVVGAELSASVVDFVPRPDSYAYQWYADNVAISGQTGTRIVLSSAEAGKSITVKVTAQRSGFNNRSETSLPCGPVGLMEMTTTTAPVITGTPEYGQSLAVDTGLWEPTPSSFSYQWRLDDLPITTATRSTYTLKASDVGHQLTVAVTGAKTGFVPTTRVSEPVGVDVGTMPGGTPVVTGTPTVGHQLTGSIDEWLPTGTTFTYTWLAGDTVLKTGTSKTLLIPGIAAGRPITLLVTGTRLGYETTERNSAPTAVVAKGTLVTTAPRISGTVKVGRILSARVSGWAPYGVKYSYRWRINGAPVRYATRSTWRIPRSAKGKRITVTVTGTLTGYTSVARTSARTVRVAG
ncbi:hypothetical protein [Aeromicrobium sp. NPDC092404]|uniref:hypothetical protein n=1 Tax=Aeromicrobium sp. NPDC092404 TaxID=3154976 RepID=UPI00342C0EA9